MEPMTRHDPLRTALPLTLAALLWPAAAIAAPIGPDRFGPDAVVESFERMTPRHNVAHPIQNLLLPGIEGPFRFDSGVMLSGPFPNPAATNRANPGSVAILDFSGPLDPALGITVAGIGTHGTISDAGQVPFGSAFLSQVILHGTPPLEFRFDADVDRVGAYVTGTPGTVTLSAYDAADVLLETVSIPTVDRSLWAGNFLGLERAEGIRKVTFSGDHLVLDGLTFEPGYPVPEPSALLAWGALASAAGVRFRLSRRRSGT
jgi:hypothetical protein